MEESYVLQREATRREMEKLKQGKPMEPSDPIVINGFTIGEVGNLIGILYEVALPAKMTMPLVGKLQAALRAAGVSMMPAARGDGADEAPDAA